MSEETKQSRGGNARAVSLSPERRKEIAQAAAKQRWDTVAAEAVVPDIEPLAVSPEMPIARWRGILNIVGIDVPCYVLDDGRKIIGRTSATEVLTGIKGGGALEKYLAVKALEPFIDSKLVLEKFVPFRLPDVEGLDRAVKGLPAELWIDVCQGFVSALNSTLNPTSTHPRMTSRQVQMAIQASMFLSACAKVGLEALIDEATGYQYERAEDALAVKLSAFLAEELRAWEKTFPDELWLEFGRLTGWEGSLRSRPKWWGHLVTELVYDTLDPDVADWLKDNKPPKGVKWHQQLSENLGVRKLVSRCWEVIGMAKTCRSIPELKSRVAEHYGKSRVQFSMYLPEPLSRPSGGLKAKPVAAPSGDSMK